MVSIVWAAIAASLGLLVYLLPPVLARGLPGELQESIGDFYYRQSLRSFESVAFVKRVIGGYELLPIAVDDEQKHAQVTLSSGVVSDDKTLPFDDPDGRIGRLFAKPIALVYEGVPAAIDAELAELAHWTNQKATDEGIEHETTTVKTHDETGTAREVETKVIDPYVEVPTALRAADPLDALSLVCKDVEPENIETTKQLTRERFAKYGSRIGMMEMLTFTGFAIGLGGVAAVEYMRSEILDRGPGGGSVNTGLPPLGQVAVPWHHLVDLVGVVG